MLKNHGFEATINIADTGEHTFYAHAINRGATGEGFPNTLLTNCWTTTINEPIPHDSEMSSGAGQTIADGYYAIYSQLKENFYLDISEADTPAEAGTNVHVWTHDDKGLPLCDVWEIRYVDNGFYTIQQMHSDSTLDVYNADTARGTNVQTYP